MRSLLQNPLWGEAKINRQYQRLFGRIAGLFLAIALISLFDGLIAQMRAGSNELELLPGQSLTLSGPSALKNPVTSDLKYQFSPHDAPIKFELEGFFTGYWFGNGMWRGQLSALPEAEPGHYDLAISFRGASAQSAQKYIIQIFADSSAMQAGSLSLIRRYLGINPFILAAGCGGLGIFCGIFTYWFGRRFANFLYRLGLAEIYASEGSQLWCLAPKNLAPQPGNVRMVLNANGQLFGEARADFWQKGKLKLTLLDGGEAPAGALICLRHPGDANYCEHCHVIPDQENS